jgi:transposase
MNSLAKLDQLNLEAATKTEVAALIQSLIEQTERDAKIIQAKDVKIAALTHELAYYKRIRFSTKSEALAPLQRDVFEETWTADLSAIEAEVEQLQDTAPCETVARPKRTRAGRQPLPPHLPRIEHRHEPESCTCGQCGRDMVKIGDDCMDAGGRATQEQLPKMSANNWMSSRPSFSCIGTFVHNTLAELAKPSLRHRFHRQ